MPTETVTLAETSAGVGINTGAQGMDSRRSLRAWHVVRDMWATWEASAPPRIKPRYVKKRNRIGANGFFKSGESDQFIVV